MCWTVKRNRKMSWKERTIAVCCEGNKIHSVGRRNGVRDGIMTVGGPERFLRRTIFLFHAESPLDACSDALPISHVEGLDRKGPDGQL